MAHPKLPDGAPQTARIRTPNCPNPYLRPPDCNAEVTLYLKLPEPEKRSEEGGFK
jgi:hypothetical protein